MEGKIGRVEEDKQREKKIKERRTNKEIKTERKNVMQRRTRKE